MLVDPVEIQLSSKGLIRTHSRKVERHDRLFESNLAVNLEGFAIRQPGDNVVETFSFYVIEEIIHFVREMFRFPFDMTANTGTGYAVR